MSSQSCVSNPEVTRELTSTGGSCHEPIRNKPQVGPIANAHDSPFRGMN